MHIKDNLWTHDATHVLGKDDVLVLILDCDGRNASVNKFDRRKPIAELLPDNRIGWFVEFADDAPFVSQEGRRFLSCDPGIAAALDDIAAAPSFERIEFVRNRIAAFDGMTVPPNDHTPAHTCALVATSLKSKRRQAA